MRLTNNDLSSFTYPGVNTDFKAANPLEVIKFNKNPAHQTKENIILFTNMELFFTKLGFSYFPERHLLSLEQYNQKSFEKIYELSKSLDTCHTLAPYVASKIKGSSLVFGFVSEDRSTAGSTLLHSFVILDHKKRPLILDPKIETVLKKENFGRCHQMSLLNFRDYCGVVIPKNITTKIAKVGPKGSYINFWGFLKQQVLIDRQKTKKLIQTAQTGEEFKLSDYM